MKRSSIVLLTICTVLLLSCQAQDSKTTNAQPSAATSVKAEQSRYQRVIFFALSSTELNSLVEKDPSMVEIMDDFDFYVSEFMTTPGRADLELLYNDKEIILLEKGEEHVEFNRNKQPEPFGVILTDGIHEPMIRSGVFASENYQQMCLDYFGKEKK